jgi:hypothetical protein
MKSKKVRSRLLPVLLAIVLVLGMTPTAAFGAEGDTANVSTAQFSDMPDNWSTQALQKAVSNGLLSGADGRIMPDQNLTRAQMATVITRAFGATVAGDLSGFTDVKQDDWFSDGMAKAYQMGVIEGSGSQMNPNSAITRQEVFVILGRALKLQPAEKMNKTFGDADKIAGWAKGEVAAFVNAGYIQGAGGKLNPTSLITRAEFAQIFDNLIKQYINTAGEYDQVAEGNIMINTPAVSLRNAKVTGDLIIGDGVGNGEVTLDGVEVAGRLVVRGGGENSIIIKGNSSVASVVVARVDGAVSVKVQDDAKVEVVYIDDGSDDVSVQGKIGTLEISASDITVKAAGATINNVTVEGAGAKVVVDSASKISLVAIRAQNTEVSGTGNVTKVEAQAGATGSRIATPNTQIVVGAGVTGIKGGGGASIDPGTTTNNNEDGSGVTKPTATLPTGSGHHGSGNSGTVTVSPISDANVTVTSGSIVFNFSFEASGGAITYTDAVSNPYYLDTAASTMTLSDGVNTASASISNLNIAGNGTVSFANIAAVQTKFPSLSFEPDRILLHFVGASSVNSGTTVWTKDITIPLGGAATALLTPPAPALSALSADSYTDSGARLNFTSNVPGTYYYLVKRSEEGAADVSAVKAQGAAAAKATGTAQAAANTATVTGLEPNKSYTAYIIVEDAGGGLSSVGTADITTTKRPVNIAAVPGVTAPEVGAAPVTTITETDQYTGVITWSPATTRFKAGQSYTARITLTPKSDYTLTGVAENFFTVAGAASDTNSANTGVITAVFPDTKVLTAAQFEEAIEDTSVTTITLGRNIMGDVTAVRTGTSSFTIDFSSYVLTGSLDLTASDAAAISLQGGTQEEISGNLTISAASATVTNGINIHGTLNISAVSVHTWIEVADGNRIIVHDNNGATIEINGNPEDIEVSEGSTGINITAISPVVITVASGAAVENITIGSDAEGSTIINNGSLDGVNTQSTINIENNTTAISVTGSGGVGAYGDAAASVSGTNVVIVQNISDFLGLAAALKMGATTTTTITGADMGSGDVELAVTSADNTVINPSGLTVTALKHGRVALTVQIKNSDDVTTKQGTFFVTVLPETISSATVAMTAPAAGAAPQTAAMAEAASGAGRNYTVTGLTWSDGLTAEGKFKAGQVYSASVTLTSKNDKAFDTTAFTPAVAGSSSVGAAAAAGAGVGNSVTFTVAFPATAAKSVTDIKVTTQPADMTYTAGETLTLNGMVITEINNDGSKNTVSFTDGTAARYTASPANGTVLSTAAHGYQPVTVTHTASGKTAVTGKLNILNQTQLAPETPKGVAAMAGLANGRITGVTAAMEYKTAKAAAYTSVTGTEITGLAGGTYQVRFKAKTNYDPSPALTVQVPGLESIAVAALPVKTVYKVGESLDISGLIVTGTYSDSSTRTETVGISNVTGFKNYAVSGSQTLTVTVGSRITTFTVSIVKADGPVLTGVSANNATNTMSGMTALMEFSTDGTSWTAYNAAAPNLPNLTGSMALHVRAAATATHNPGPEKIFYFSVATLQSIAVNADTAKKDYKVGEPLDITGLIVTGTYDDTTTKQEAIAASNISGFNSSAVAGSQTLTVTVNGQTASYTIIIEKADGPALAGVSHNDAANLVTGMTEAMEFSMDGVSWTAYNAATPNLPTLTGTEVLQVRVKETATHLAGAPKTFAFTVNLFTLTYTAGPNGSISGSTPQTVAYDESGTEVTAVPATGYHFVNWSDGITKAARTDANVKASRSITANFAANQHTVTFKNYDNTVLKTQKVYYQTAAMAPETPAKAADAKYTYEFLKWSTDFSSVTGDLTVIAEYKSLIRNYAVTFVDYDGDVLKTQTVACDNAATAPANPVREGYAFAGWNMSFSKITADLTVTATYTANPAINVTQVSAVDGTTIDVTMSAKDGLTFTFNGTVLTSDKISAHDKVKYVLTVPKMTSGGSNSLVISKTGYTSYSNTNIVWTSGAGGYNGNVAGVITTTATGGVSGTLTGAYNLTITGQVEAPGYVGNYATFSGIVAGDINGSITARINANGIDTMSGTITGTGAAQPVRIIGTFPQTGTTGDFTGKIITGAIPTYVTDMTITAPGTTVKAGETLNLGVVITPTGASKEAAWSVEAGNASIATVDSATGVLTGVSPGTTAVIVKALDGSLADDTIEINVLASEDTAYVKTEAELNAALANAANKSISLASDITTSAIVRINNPVTVNGGGYTLKVMKDLGKGASTKHALDIFADNVTVNNLTIDSNKLAYGVQAYLADNITLSNVTLKNSTGAGLTVNGSSLTARNLFTSGNVWGAVNVDPGSGVTGPSVFTLTGSGILAESKQIWSDGAHLSETATVTVSAAGYNKYLDQGVKTYPIWLNELKNVVTINNADGDAIYPDIQQAVNAATNGAIVTIAKGTYNITSTININKPITVQGADQKTTRLIGGRSIGSTVTLNGGATLKNLTVTRDNSGDWATNANGSLVVMSNLSADTTLENCIITQGRNGVYLNTSHQYGHKAIIKGNKIFDTRTGIHFASDCSDTEITGNEVTGCWTIGFVQYNSSAATAATALNTIKLKDNIIKDNWLAQILIKTPAPADADSTMITGLLDLTSNDFGGAIEGEIQTITVANSYNAAHAEPAYEEQKPVSVGGSALKPDWTPPTVRIYKQPKAGVTGSGIEFVPYSDGDTKAINVTSEAQLGAALADPAVTDVNLTADFSTTKMIVVNRAVTINGGGHKITVSKDLGKEASSKHAMDIYAGNVTVSNLIIDSNFLAFGAQAYKADNVSLNNVTLKNSTGAGLTVNGSGVTANDLNTSGNVWGAVNIDPGSGVTLPSVFRLTGSGILTENKQIWSDGKYVTETVPVTVTADGYSKYKVNGSETYLIWLNELKNTAVIGDKIYADIQTAVNAASAGDTVTVGKGTYNLAAGLNISKAITVTGADKEETVLVGGRDIAATVNISSGAALKTLTVTRDNSGDWATNLNGSLVSFGQGLTADTTLENCILTHGRNGVYLNNAGANGYKAVIKDNDIFDTRTGINFTNNCSGTVITGNEITDCWTIGIVYYNNSVGTALNTLTLKDNIIKDNWVGQILIKTPAPTDAPSVLTTGNLDISDNDFGGAVTEGLQTVTIATAYSAIHAEPAYADQRPVSVGGTAVKPTAWIPPAIRIYGQPNAGVTGSGVSLDYTYSDTASGKVNVATAAELAKALTDPDVLEIYLTADFSTTKMVAVNRAVTIDGGGHKLTVAEDLGTDNSSKHAMDIFADNVTVSNLTIDSNSLAYGAQAYAADNTVLNNVELINSKGAGLTVNGSIVTANALHTSGNVWGAVNVDPGSGVTAPSAFTLTGKSILAENNKIWSDGANVKESVPTATVTVTADGYDRYRIYDALKDNDSDLDNDDNYIWTDNLKNAVTMESVIYPGIQAAIDVIYALSDPADITTYTVNVANGTYTEDVKIIQDVNKNIVLQASNVDEATLKGGIGINGAGRLSGAESLTIKGFTFDYSDAAEDKDMIYTCAVLGITYNYSHNIIIEGCDFIGNPSCKIVAVRAGASGGHKNYTIRNAEGTDLHSLGQFTSVATVNIENVDVSGGRSGLNLNNSTDMHITGFTFEGTEDGIRVGQGGSGIPSDNTITIEDSSLVSSFVCSEDSFSDPDYVPHTAFVLRGDAAKNIIITDSTIKNSNENGNYDIVNMNTSYAEDFKFTLTNVSWGDDGLHAAGGLDLPVDTAEYVPVTVITGVPDSVAVGAEINLSDAAVTPSEATNKTIVWTFKSGGDTGVTAGDIEDGTFIPAAAGELVLTATVKNGETSATDYTQDFTIIITA